MKKISFYIAVTLFFSTIYSCKKKDLNLINPNIPVQEVALNTEGGIKNFALGIINRQIGNVINAGSLNLKAVADIHHSIMGDEQFSPYGNFGMRWSNQVYRITLPNGTVVTNPFGVTQKQSLQGFNSRQAGDRNVFLYEWAFCYFYISQANILIEALKNPELKFSGDAATKIALLNAWAYWWKGFAYSRLGSLYIAGIINNKTDGTTQGSYVTRAEIINEANKNLEEAAKYLSKPILEDEYIKMYKAITPSYNSPDDVITAQMWKRQINTILARNLLVNKKVTEMTVADWTALRTYTGDGVQVYDKVFQQGMTLDGNNDVVGSFYHPYVLIGPAQEFLFVSERLIQDYKTNDARLTRNFFINPSPYPANIRSRGLQFGTRWAVKNIENGGKFSTSDNRGLVSVAGTFEENQLMEAEALIRTGQVEAGLRLIDGVRTFQQAQLPAVEGTNLTQAQAIEELRKERRVGLFMRGLAFYDARRWGVIAPVAQGGGRANALVYLPANLAGGTISEVRSCFMEYNYMDYFDVPLTELDFNSPEPGSAPVKN